MRKRFEHCTLLLVALALLLLPLSAAGEETEAEHGWHRHHVGLFAGGAHRSEHSENGWVLEGEYEYRFIQHLGFGVLTERTFDVEHDPWLLVFPLTVHPYRGLRIATGPGVEFPDGEDEEFVWRFGLGWDLPIGRGFHLTPGVNADLVAGDWNFTYGLQFGYAF